MHSISLTGGSELDRDHLTKAKIAAVVRSVHRWKSLADLFDNEETNVTITEIMDELNILMAGLGGQVKVKAVRSAKGKSTGEKSQLLYIILRSLF